MYTPAQLRDRLLTLGIDRELRTLTDWRQKGLLPPLARASAGRGKGVRMFWRDDPLDQAIAVDWLLADSGQANEAVFGLWLSGYPVDHAAAKSAWVEYLKRVQRRRDAAAARYAGGYVGLALSWWRKLTDGGSKIPPTKELPQPSIDLMRDLFADTQEWVRDDAERDDSAYRYQLAELIIALMKADRKVVYGELDRRWAEIDPVAIFAATGYKGFVESLSVAEMRGAQTSLTLVTHALQHLLGVAAPLDPVNRVVLPLKLMRDVFGPLVARCVIKATQIAPEIPLRQSISTLHDFVLSVQSTDINQKVDGSVVFSERVRGVWQTTAKQLSQIWTATA